MPWGSFIVGLCHNQIDQIQRCPATRQDRQGLDDTHLSVVLSLIFREVLLRLPLWWASQAMVVVKNLPANTGDVGSIPSSGTSPGGEHGNPF